MSRDTLETNIQRGSERLVDQHYKLLAVAAMS